MNIHGILDDLGIEAAFTTDQRTVCVCPFITHEHDHIKPAFNVREVGTDYHWICFKGCGQGNLLDLVMRLQKLNAKEAHRWILLHGGVVSSDRFMDELFGEKKVRTSPDSKVFWDDYSRQVQNKTSKYIIDRGFTPQTLKSWGFRYDPEVPAIVIPIFDISNELVGLCRREVVPGAQPNKYMYSPGFDRNKHLFGACKHQSNKSFVVLVEGPLDCVWLHQCGVTSAVALLGAYCSPTQKKLVAHLGTHVVLAMDNDSAGYVAMKKIEEQLSPWFSVSRVQLPNTVKDVQELNSIQVQEVFKNTL